MRVSVLVMAALLGGGSCVPAQVFVDDFNRANGKTLPGWTAQVGAWEVRNNRLVRTDTQRGWGYLTVDGTKLRNCVLEVDVFHVGSPVQFAGLAARHPGGASARDFAMCKLQDRARGTGFRRCYSYEIGGAQGPLVADLPRDVPRARLRMTVVGDAVEVEVDTDGKPGAELTVGPKKLSRATAAGLAGVSALSTAQLDDFALYDAVLRADPGTRPKIGGKVGMLLDTDSPDAVFAAFAALGTAGIPLPGGRRIPVDNDALFQLTLAIGGSAGLQGKTDASGSAKPSLPLINDVSLVGRVLFFAAVTIDPASTLAIGRISNPLRVVIEQ